MLDASCAADGGVFGAALKTEKGTNALINCCQL